MEKPKKLGKYQVTRELGRGAMGVVYEAFDPLIERTVAIKTILKSSVDKSETEEAFNRFRREARAAGRLSHPKIVAIYEYGEDDDMAFIVMELIRGKELKDYFDREDSFSLHDGVRIVMQILDALDYSHTHGVVHRDIKPANILITRDGKIKIADFGIAKIDSSILTQAGAVMGTPTYMPPEQFMGAEVDQRADIYSTGVILYQFLTGLRPFTGGVISVMHQVINQEPAPPSHINPNVPVELDEVVKKAMAKKPEDRYQTVAEFMTALKLAGQALPAQEADAQKTGAGKPRAALKQEAYGPEGTVKLPDRTITTEVRRKHDIESWQRITNSRDPADFRRYLEEYPDGEFTELARRRLSSLTEAAAQALLQQEARIRAEKEARLRKKTEQQAAAEKAQAEARAQAEAETRRRQEAEEKERWARKIAEIKDEAEKAKAIEAARREQEAAEQVQRSRELSASLSKRNHQFVEVLSRREAAVDAERRMLKEHKRKLEEEVLRKQQAKKKLLSRKEAMETQRNAVTEENIQQEAELEKRNRELEEARQRIEAAERRRREAEERAALAHRRTRRTILITAAVLAALALGGLILFLP